MAASSFPLQSVEKLSTFRSKHKQVYPLNRKKRPWLQISSCQEVGNYSVLLGSLSSSSEFPLLLLTNNRFNDNIMRTSPGGRVEQTGHQFLPCWMSFISRCRLDMRMPTACERFPSSSLTIWKKRKNEI